MTATALPEFDAKKCPVLSFARAGVVCIVGPKNATGLFARELLGAHHATALHLTHKAPVSIASSVKQLLEEQGSLPMLGERATAPRRYVVWEDFSSSGAPFAARGMLMNGRHLNLTVVLLVTSVADMHPAVRANVDVVVAVGQPDLQLRQAVFKAFFKDGHVHGGAGVFDSARFEELAPKGNEPHALVRDMISGDVSVCAIPLPDTSGSKHDDTITFDFANPNTGTPIVFEDGEYSASVVNDFGADCVAYTRYISPSRMYCETGRCLLLPAPATEGPKN